MSAPFDFHAIAENYKTEWIEKQLKQHVNEYSQHIPAKIFCGTWNVNGKVLGDGPHIREFLSPEGESETKSDIYALGFQEIVELNPQNVLMDGSLAAARSTYWSEVCLQCLGEEEKQSKRKYKYSLLNAQHLVGVLLLVFIKEELLPHVRHIRGAVLSTGVLGLMGNKGGVAVRFNLRDTSLCFISAHLAASRASVQARNNDAAEIIRRTVFQAKSHRAAAAAADHNSNAGSSTKTSKKNVGDDNVCISAQDSNCSRRTFRGVTDAAVEHSDLCILNHHEHIFWLGDLNYRIEEEVNINEVFDRVASGDLAFLRKHDQLVHEMVEKRVFQGFSEGLLSFPPTYKFIPGENIYEQREGKKRRAPAWCDRVLWGAGAVIGAAQSVRPSVLLQSYNSVSSLTQSDHKPVYALFTCDIRSCVELKERAFYQDLLRQLDSWENESIPKIEASGRDIDFGSVRLNEVKEAVVTLHNTGTKAATWHFVSPMDDGGPLCKPCYELLPPMGMVLPGETMAVTIRVCLTQDLYNLLSLTTPSKQKKLQQGSDNDNKDKNKDSTIIVNKDGRGGRSSVDITTGSLQLDEITVIRVIGGSDFFCVVKCRHDAPVVLASGLKLSELGLGLELEEEDSDIPNANTTTTATANANTATTVATTATVAVSASAVTASESTYATDDPDDNAV